MLKKDVILLKIKEIVSKKDSDSEIFLYGSRARGNFKKNSDWDIFILLNYQNISFDLETNLMDAIYELEIETGEVISPLIYSKSDWKNHFFTPLFENVKKEGIRIK